MVEDMFAITPIQIFSWIVFGFVVALLIHAIKPIPTATPTTVAKDIILAIFGSLVGGLTIVFFYGYLLLGTFVLSIVGGIILGSVYLLFKHDKVPSEHKVFQQN